MPFTYSSNSLLPALEPTTKAIFRFMSLANGVLTSAPATVRMRASCAVIWNPTPPLMQSITMPSRSVTLLVISSISKVAPVLVASVANGLKPMSMPAPLVRLSASPVHPLLLQSKPLKAVAIFSYSHVPGFASVLARPAADSFSFMPDVVSLMSMLLFSTFT